MPIAPYDDKPEIELLDGEARAKVSPRSRHSMVQYAIATLIERCAGERGAVGTEWRFRLPTQLGAVLVPDVAFVYAERLAQLEPELRQEPPFSPDIAVEVRSPSDDVAFLTRKIARYLQTGAVIVLDVDPARRLIIAHASTNDVQQFGPGATLTQTAIPWLNLNVDDVFSRLDRFGL